jgi:hypothetical protein
MTSPIKPIRVPDDLTGFKIGVPPSPLWTSMFKALGAHPVLIPWAETYSAMQTNIADGLEQPLIGLLVDQIYEVQKYCSETNQRNPPTYPGRVYEHHSSGRSQLQRVGILQVTNGDFRAMLIAAEFYKQ